ncbi:MAG: hypothetical protein WC745_02095 [Patescibacteria group bacterium]|jgi:hypothetical protein
MLRKVFFAFLAIVGLSVLCSVYVGSVILETAWADERPIKIEPVDTTGADVYLLVGQMCKYGDGLWYKQVILLNGTPAPPVNHPIYAYLATLTLPADGQGTIGEIRSPKTFAFTKNQTALIPRCQIIGTEARVNFAQQWFQGRKLPLKITTRATEVKGRGTVGILVYPPHSFDYAFVPISDQEIEANDFRMFDNIWNLIASEHLKAATGN